MLQTTAANESERLAALALYRILDTPAEFAYDALTELAAEICRCPVALISFIGERRQWFKAKYGLPADYAECPRDITVRTAAICSNDLLYVPDLTRDERFRDSPVEVKHLGAIDMYFLDRIRPELSADADGCQPNERFWVTSGLARAAAS